MLRVASVASWDKVCVESPTSSKVEVDCVDGNVDVEMSEARVKKILAEVDDSDSSRFEAEKKQKISEN